MSISNFSKGNSYTRHEIMEQLPFVDQVASFNTDGKIVVLLVLKNNSKGYTNGQNGKDFYMEYNEKREDHNSIIRTNAKPIYIFYANSNYNEITTSYEFLDLKRMKSEFKPFFIFA